MHHSHSHSHPHVAAVILAAQLPAAGAHEFWIEPQQFRAAPGAKVPVRLNVGQYFKGNSIPWLTDNYTRLDFADARGTEKVKGVLGDDPAFTVAGRAPGRMWLVLGLLGALLVYGVVTALAGRSILKDPMLEGRG